MSETPTTGPIIRAKVAGESQLMTELSTARLQQILRSAEKDWVSLSEDQRVARKYGYQLVRVHSVLGGVMTYVGVVFAVLGKVAGCPQLAASNLNSHRLRLAVRECLGDLLPKGDVQLEGTAGTWLGRWGDSLYEARLMKQREM